MEDAIEELTFKLSCEDHVHHEEGKAKGTLSTG